MNDSPRTPHPGSFVRIRTEEEILATLSPDGALDSLPFMPEMRKYCGKIFRVYKDAETTCVDTYGARRINDAVYLEGIRCDGRAHDNCQKLCPIIWKTAWLTTVESTESAAGALSRENVIGPPSSRYKTRSGDTYYCQSTELLKATRSLHIYDIRHYISSIITGQQTFSAMTREFTVRTVAKLRTALGLNPGLPWTGHLKTTPQESLHLQPGELVEVKSIEEIRETVNTSGQNRGLEFAPEMMQFCGKRFVVLSRVEKMIMEITGRMLPISNTVILESVACDGCFHRGCARNHYFHWREIWLRRIKTAGPATPSPYRENPFEGTAVLGIQPGEREDCEPKGIPEPIIPDPYIRRLEILLSVSGTKGKREVPAGK